MSNDILADLRIGQPTQAAPLAAPQVAAAPASQQPLKPHDTDFLHSILKLLGGGGSNESSGAAAAGGEAAASGGGNLLSAIASIFA